MFDQSSRHVFVVPQRRAGRHFRDMTSGRNIDRISLETASGRHLVELPIQISVNNAVPRVLWFPLQAGVTAISILARIFRVKITLLLNTDER